MVKLSARFWSINTLCIVMLTTAAAMAHSGPTAIALPITGITIDGDLSDWPSGLTVYKVDPDNATESNFQGQFRLGFDKSDHALYVAIQVDDDRVVSEGKKGELWNAQDSCEVYVDALHRRTPGPGVQFYFRQAYGCLPSMTRESSGTCFLSTTTLRRS